MFLDCDCIFSHEIISNAQYILGILSLPFFFRIKSTKFEHFSPSTFLRFTSLNDRRFTEIKFLNFLKLLSDEIKIFENLKFSVDLGQLVR